MVQKYEVRITRQALKQMQQISDYIVYDLCSADAAKNLLNEMEELICSLDEMPTRMPLVDEEPWRTEGIRKAIVRNFLVYFWIDNENRKIQVVAVVYEKRDQREQLKKLDG